ncbi:MAG: hypothetical protein AAFX05_11535 [Planctomycetota bacterium]
MSEHHTTPHTSEELEASVHEHDEWFRHSPDEPHHQAEHGGFNPIVVMGFLAATILITFGVAAVVLPWFAREVQAQRVQVQEANSQYGAEYREKMEGWVSDLSKPAWVDAENNVVRLPLDLAVERVIEQYER